MSAAFTLVDRLPTVAEFQQLRESAGWTRVADDAVARALHQTLFAVCLEQDGQLVGSGRIVGDGAIYFYIQDVIVLLPFRGTGRKGFVGRAVRSSGWAILRADCSIATRLRFPVMVT